MEREHASKRGKKSQKKSGTNHMVKNFLLCILIIGIAVISFLLGRYWQDNKTNNDIKSLVGNEVSTEATTKSEPSTTDEPANHKTSSASAKTMLNGSWYSTDNGVMLTIKGDSFSIDYSNVDTKTPIKGSIRGDKKQLIFSNDHNDGIYTYHFKEDSTLILKVVNDSHLKRSSALDSQEWIRF